MTATFPTVLAVDLGTTSVKASIWNGGGLCAIGRAPLATDHRAGAEQDPSTWWTAIVTACADLPARRHVAAVTFSTARQTFVPVTAAADPLGPALLWSDRRDGAGTVAGKVAWLAAHDPRRLAQARWLLGPRDLAILRLTGEAVTDMTVAITNGPTGRPDLEPRVVEPTAVVGASLPAPAGELGVPRGTLVVAGAGDRQCEVLGTGASSTTPMISWGTTANVSLPVGRTARPVAGLLSTPAAPDGWQLEGGLSAAGSLLDWLERLSGRDDLMAAAGSKPPGANGVLCLPWLGGARAPWWSTAAAAFAGLSPAHDAGDLARAAIEGVAWDVARCLDIAGCRPESIALAGGGAASRAWIDAVTGVCGAGGVRRRSGEAASAGAALLAWKALGVDVRVDDINPVVSVDEPPPAAVEAYRALRPAVDAAASAVAGLAG